MTTTAGATATATATATAQDCIVFLTPPLEGLFAIFFYNGACLSFSLLPYTPASWVAIGGGHLKMPSIHILLERK